MGGCALRLNPRRLLPLGALITAGLAAWLGGVAART
jgi:hypothetical protein